MSRRPTLRNASRRRGCDQATPSSLGDRSRRRLSCYGGISTVGTRRPKSCFVSFCCLYVAASPRVWILEGGHPSWVLCLAVLTSVGVPRPVQPPSLRLPSSVLGDDVDQEGNLQFELHAALAGKSRQALYSQPSMALVCSTNLDAGVAHARVLSLLGHNRDASSAYSTLLAGTRVMSLGGSAASAHLNARCIIGRGAVAAASTWLPSAFKLASVSVVMPDVMRAMTTCDTLGTQDIRAVRRREAASMVVYCSGCVCVCVCVWIGGWVGGGEQLQCADVSRCRSMHCLRA